MEKEFAGFTRLSDGRLVGNRVVDYGSLTPKRLAALLRKENGKEGDIERLKDYKWILLFDATSANEKGFMSRYLADGGFVLGFKNKFWLSDIDSKIKEISESLSIPFDVSDLVNNPLVCC